METREAKPGDLGGPISTSGLELRDALGGVFKDIDEGTHQVLVEFPHETVDSYKTKFGVRAFEDSFNRRLPVMCWQHDLRDPIGIAINAQITPKVNELRGQFSDLDRVPNAGRAFSQISDKTLQDFSFGFKNAKYEAGGQRGVRRITQAFMAEFSPVTIGSIPGAGAVGIREDGNTMEDEFELSRLFEMRDSGMLTPKGFESLVREHHPEVAEHIVVLAQRATTADTDGDGPDNGSDPVQWTAMDAGMHTATGPNGKRAIVQPMGESHVWSVMDPEGTSESGKEADVASAKSAAEGLLKRDQQPDEVRFEFDPEDVNADLVRSAIELFVPELGQVLSQADIRVDPSIGTATTSGGTDNTYAASMASAVDAALDSAVQWLKDVDVAALPDNVQQALALVQAGATSAALLLEAMGITDPDDDGDEGSGGGRSDEELEEEGLRFDGEDLEERAAAAGMSTKPWGDFKDSDYSDEQYKNAALIKGKDKSDSHLPVKEPDGTLNVHGLAAAAGRLDKTDATPGQKKAAAKTLMGHYGKMKKQVPPSVLKHASGNKREDEGPTEDEIRVEAEALEERKAQALARLDKIAKPAATEDAA